MSFPRRKLLAALPATLAMSATMPRPGCAEGTTDLAVTCDAAAATAVVAAATAYRSKTGVRVRVFATAPGLVLPQLEREIQNDIIVTQLITIDQAEKAGLVAPGGRTAPWRNRLVTATAKQPGGPDGSFVVPDPSPASDIDGGAILRRIGISPAMLLGVIDTGAVAWTLAGGGARMGLLHQTEVVANDRLRAVSPIADDAWPPILYAAAITKLARRGDPAGFIAFLGSPDGLAALRSAGLDATS